jgi:hypothetical protein
MLSTPKVPTPNAIIATPTNPEISFIPIFMPLLSLPAVKAGPDETDPAR